MDDAQAEGEEAEGEEGHADGLFRTCFTGHYNGNALRKVGQGRIVSLLSGSCRWRRLSNDSRVVLLAGDTLVAYMAG